MRSLSLCNKSTFALAGFGLAAALATDWTPLDAQKEGSSGSTVLELRQYTLHPGQRDVLIDVFERNFVEGQETEGMRIVGTFRDLDNPDRFVWLRSFPDMAGRAAALNGFYHGPVWKAHRVVANATMVDAANVLLLRPARPGTGFQIVNAALPPRDSSGAGRGIIVASIVYLRRPTAGKFLEFFEKTFEPQWRSAGGSVLAKLVTEHSANNFSALPIREGEEVFVWFSEFADQAALEQHRRVLAESDEWRTVAATLSLWTHQRIETLRLQPTARSRLQAFTIR